MKTFTAVLKQRPVATALGLGGLMASIWMVSFTTLAYAPRACLAVLSGAFTAFLTYDKSSASRESFRTATLLTAGIGLVCLVGLLVVAVT